MHDLPGVRNAKELLQSNLHGSNVRTRNPRFTLLSPAPRSVLPREGGICARSMRARSSARGAPRKKRELLPTRTQPGRGLASERSTQPRTSARRTRRKGHETANRWSHLRCSPHPNKPARAPKARAVKDVRTPRSRRRAHKPSRGVADQPRLISHFRSFLAP